MELPKGRLPGEEFRLIEGFEAYCISNYGRVCSRWKRASIGNGQELTKHWRYLNPAKDKDGYLRISLFSGFNEVKHAKIHILVLETFVGLKPEGYECRHLDGRRLNNHVGNLCWGTHIDNIRDKDLHETHNKGISHNMVKLTESDVLEIRARVKANESQTGLAKEYEVSDATISRIINFSSWKHI